MKILIATNNNHKVKEFKLLLAGFGADIVTPKEIGLKLDVVEDGTTFGENAYKKAYAFCIASGLCSIADDSGIEVDYLGGEPGIYSARYGGAGLDDEARTMLLLKNMQGIKERAARFVCAISVVFPDDRKIAVQESCRGRLAEKPYGNGGFGYDPIFIPDGYDKTFSELGDDIKNKISHRAKALMTLKKNIGNHF